MKKVDVKVWVPEGSHCNPVDGVCRFFFGGKCGIFNDVMGSDRDDYFKLEVCETLKETK